MAHSSWSAIIFHRANASAEPLPKLASREELAFWFPEFEAQLQQLEARVAGVAAIPEHRRLWGWGASMREPDRRRGTASEPLCSSCDSRFMEPQAD